MMSEKLDFLASSGVSTAAPQMAHPCDFSDAPVVGFMLRAPIEPYVSGKMKTVFEPASKSVSSPPSAPQSHVSPSYGGRHDA